MSQRFGVQEGRCRRRTWWDFPFVEHGPEDDGLVEVSDNGFQLCVPWAAGSAFAARSYQPNPNPVSVTADGLITGVTSRFTSERPAADEELIDTSVNDYLAQAPSPGSCGRPMVLSA